MLKRGSTVAGTFSKFVHHHLYTSTVIYTVARIWISLTLGGKP